MRRALAALGLLLAGSACADPAPPDDAPVDVLVTERDGEGFVRSRPLLTGVRVLPSDATGALTLDLDADQAEVLAETGPEATLQVVPVRSPARPAPEARRLQVFDVRLAP